MTNEWGFLMIHWFLLLKNKNRKNMQNPWWPSGTTSRTSEPSKLLFDSAIIVFWLVVWLPFLAFSHILGIIIPIDCHIFQRGSNHQPDVVSKTLFNELVEGKLETGLSPIGYGKSMVSGFFVPLNQAIDLFNANVMNGDIIFLDWLIQVHIGLWIGIYGFSSVKIIWKTWDIYVVYWVSSWVLLCLSVFSNPMSQILGFISPCFLFGL